MSNICAIELKTGNIIKFKNSLYKVVSTEHVKPGKGGAFMQVELKGITNNTKLNERFRSEDVVERVHSEMQKVEFLYRSGQNLEVMDDETYEVFSLNISLLNSNPLFLKENMKMTLDIINNEPVLLKFPETVECKIEETAPYLNGQTIKSSFKNAVLDNGMTISVPEFISIGDKVIVSTATSEYKSKA